MSLTKRIQPMISTDRSLTQKGILSFALVLALIGSLEVDASSVYRGRRGRSLTTDAEIAQIRRNIAEFPAAGKIADNIVRAADEWVARPDRVLWELIPTSDVPRAFNSSFEGCPIHGMEYFKHGNYSWKMDPFGKPWKIVCPVGGEEYPSNDFLAFYKSGMKDRSLLTGDYPDDGWGWRKPGDEKKHWFVAYYCHWLWKNYIIRGISHLAYAYEITGDERYARKAIVMLDRIAEVYPDMDYNKQSRYAAEFRPSYSGKIVNYIWENGLVSVLAFAYGGAFDLLAQEGTWPDKNSPLYGKSYAEIRQNIENNILRVAVAGVFDGRIRGNYGMHQRTLGHLAIVLQDDALTKRVVDYILNNSTGDAAVEGFNYALDNFVFREGISFETAPGYCLGWSANLATVAELLDQLGVDVFASPKLKRMLTAYLELQVLRRFTPAIGDSGGVRSGAVRLPPVLAKLGLRKLRDPVFAKYLLEGGVFGAKSFKTYADLKLPPLDEAELRRAARGASDTYVGSRNLGGYGLAILEMGKADDGVGVAVSYGPAAAGHAHFDRLFFELYGYGKGLIPDLGYPQFAAEAKDPAAWERNTLSHCTVTIDAKRQAAKRTGSLHLFAGLPDVQVLHVSAPEAYPHVRTYRRMMLLIGEEPESAYVVDFFRVEGGRSHDYSLHGFDGDFSTTGIQLSPPQEKGTLAGEDVAYSFLYDDADLEKPGKTRSYHTYHGSGYSYLYNVQRAVPSGTWAATWEDKEVGIHAIFPRQGTHEAVVANGNPPKRRGNPESLKYILLRNSGEEGLSSSFVCVLQPFRMRGGRKPAPLEVRTIKAHASGAILLEIRGDSGLDYVWLGGNPNEAVEVGGLSIRATCAVVRLDAEGGLRSVSLAGGGHVKQGLLSFELGPEVQGVVTGLDVEENRLVIEACNPVPDVADLVGQTAIFGASGRSRNYRIQDAWSDPGRLVLALGNDIPRTGKFAVENIDPDGKFVTTKTVLYLAAGGHYKGAWLANEDHTAWHRIVDVSKGKIELMTPTHLESQLTDRDGDGRITAYLYDVGPGEQVSVPAVGWIGPDASGEWRLQANCPARASLPCGTKLQKGF